MEERSWHSIRTTSTASGDRATNEQPNEVTNQPTVRSVCPVRLAYKPYFSANEQYFSLAPNQPTILSAMAYQPNKSKRTGRVKTSRQPLNLQRI